MYNCLCGILNDISGSAAAVETPGTGVDPRLRSLTGHQLAEIMASCSSSFGLIISLPASRVSHSLASAPGEFDGQICSKILLLGCHNVKDITSNVQYSKTTCIKVY